jgi:hypothetical protein
MSIKKGLIFGLIAASLILGMISMKRAMPNPKEERIYEAIKVYSPYVLEKRIGGLAIVDKRDGEKEKPSATEALHRMDELEQTWGKKHLRVEGNQVLVIGDNNQSVAKIFIETQKEREFLKNFFGI